ncbi:hypothetical protein NC651_017074 [Populus alba x Populus x berolinensis]|nr:hypothetical protein NC651_017074 [Populus alba x Populus x berolinensis]
MFMLDTWDYTGHTDSSAKTLMIVITLSGKIRINVGPLYPLPSEADDLLFYTPHKNWCPSIPMLPCRN